MYILGNHGCVCMLIRRLIPCKCNHPALVASQTHQNLFCFIYILVVSDVNKSQISLKQRPVLFGAASLLTAEGQFSATFYSLTLCTVEVQTPLDASRIKREMKGRGIEQSHRLIMKPRYDYTEDAFCAACTHVSTQHIKLLYTLACQRTHMLQTCL